MFCKFCGSEIDNDSSFCRFCGKRVSNLALTNESNEHNHTQSQSVVNKTKIKPVVYDDTYEPNSYIAKFGFLLLFLTIFTVFINQTEFVYDKNFEIFRVVVISLASFLRLFSTIIVIQTAKEQNRNPIFWGIFAFFLPSFALIGIGQMTRIIR